MAELMSVAPVIDRRRLKHAMVDAAEGCCGPRCGGLSQSGNGSGRSHFVHHEVGMPLIAPDLAATSSKG